VHRASCKGLPTERKIAGVRGFETGASPDGSLVWNWNVYENGARIIWVEQWDGATHRKVAEDKVE
jgi:hypothetical protein